MSMECLCILCVILTFFDQCFIVSEYRSFTPLVRFIARYIEFWCSCKWDQFLISLSAALLSVYRKATDFSILVLYSLTSLNLCVSSSLGFWWTLLGLYIEYHVICK